MTIDQIVEETRLWPDGVVAELVDRIMLAKHGVDDPALSPAWSLTRDAPRGGDPQRQGAGHPRWKHRLTD